MIHENMQFAVNYHVHIFYQDIKNIFLNILCIYYCVSKKSGSTISVKYSDNYFVSRALSCARDCMEAQKLCILFQKKNFLIR